MSSENEDNDQPRPPKTRGEVYAQEQERIAEEAKTDKSKEPRPADEHYDKSKEPRPADEHYD